MVFGDPGPYILKKPTVIYNKNTTLFVMWARMELLNTTSFQKRMSAVAVSPYSDGPFFLRRTFFPDGNRTADQIVFITDQNIPVLARTYFQTIEYLSPKQIMQPIWESVKYRNGSVNYRNNYHRTEYSVNYDNAHDIFNQIWRKENIPWEIHCINKITNITRVLNFTNTYPREGPICVTPDERKLVVGSGQVPIQSRFVDPSNPGDCSHIDIVLIHLTSIFYSYLSVYLNYFLLYLFTLHFSSLSLPHIHLHLFLSYTFLFLSSPFFSLFFSFSFFLFPLFSQIILFGSKLLLIPSMLNRGYHPIKTDSAVRTVRTVRKIFKRTNKNE